jgi:signal transduction histidine kinase/CheY-like chemotaxis protein
MELIMIESVLRRTFKHNPEVETSIFELKRDIANKLLIVFILVYLVWHIFKTVIVPIKGLWNVWEVSLIIFPAFLLTWYVQSRHFLLSQIIWHVTLFISITVAAQGFRDPHVYYLYALLPFSVVITIGLAGGVIMEVILGFAAWVLANQIAPWLGLPFGDGEVILSLGAALGLIAWAIGDTILTVGEWYINSFMRAQDSMEEIRLQRIQLAQVIKNLDQAYYRLQRTNADLVAAWKVAAEAERLKTEFATHISHELRTPLNLIAGFSEMMMISPENYGSASLPGAYRRDLNTIYNSARHLLDLVDDVIDLARLDAGRTGISREDVDPAGLVQEATAMVRSYIEAKGLNFSVEIDSMLPMLRMDRLRIRQVLLNLLVNATRFTDKGTIQVSVAREAGGSMVGFRVSDTGRGMGSDEMDKLFLEFSPGEKPNDSGMPWHSGSGLGLPISKKFVDLHQGRMGVESELGKGTTIWFELPVLEKEEHGDAGLISADSDLMDGPIFLTERDVARPAEQRLAVLLHPDRRLPGFLQRHIPGWRVQGARDVEKLREITREAQVSAILLDSREETPELDLNLPLVACPLPSGRRLAQALGVRAFLSKPVTREDLFEAIDRLQTPVRRLLVVDDDIDMISMLQRMMVHRIQPQDFYEAGNGEEALEILVREKPDLVLLDLMMPLMDGRELLSRMRAIPELNGIAVIVISALEEPASELVGNLRVVPPSQYSPAQILVLVKNILDTISGLAG